MSFLNSLEFWSSFMFWFIAINIVMTMCFTIVVIIGGIFDLRFLLRALKEEVVDENDNGTAAQVGQ